MNLEATRRVLHDEETLSLEQSSLDLVLSSIGFHWINDLPGVLVQINDVLKPDCAFMRAILVDDLLFEV